MTTVDLSGTTVAFVPGAGCRACARRETYRFTARLNACEAADAEITVQLQDKADETNRKEQQPRPLSTQLKRL